MASELTSVVAKEYGLNTGASVVGIAASKDFDLAPDGFKSTDVLPECRYVIVLGEASLWILTAMNSFKR